MTVPNLRTFPNDPVSSWLEKLPLFRVPPSQSDQISRSRGEAKKRPASASSATRDITSKRRHLAEISANAPRSMDPQKQSKIADNAEPITPITKRKSRRGGRVADPDDTPKSTADISSTGLDGAFGPTGSFTPSSHRSSCSTTSTSSIASGRSRSPQKHLGDTQFSSVPIQRRTLTYRNLSPEMKSLYKDLYDISLGIGLLPQSMQVEFEKVDTLVNKQEWATGKEDENPEYTRSFFNKAQEIWSLGNYCARRGVAEARWNAEVHCQLLRLAIWKQPRLPSVSYEDITTARISDRSLLGTVGNTAVQSRLVDYAIIIEDSTLLPSIVARLKQTGGSRSSLRQSVNCTSAEYIRFNPIAINIETKKEGSSGDEYLQLGIWMTAHFMKLRQLLLSGVALPILPVLTAEGHIWKFMLAEMESTSEGDRLVIWSHLTLGDSSTLPGVYRVVAALYRLALWVEDSYRPWFLSQVLS